MRYFDILTVGPEEVPLEPTISGMTVTVPKGSFTIKGVRYSLMEDEEVELEVLSVCASYYGWLVYDKGNEETRLLIDRVVEGGIEEAYDFKNDSNYLLLYRLFMVDVSPGASPETIDDHAYIFRFKGEDGDGP